MSETAKSYDAVPTPTKVEFTRQFGAVAELLGSYRLVDPDEDVGIEMHIGRDLEGRLVQMPTTYRFEELDPAATLLTFEHDSLGTCRVANALGDPVAVREFIRTIVQGDGGAAHATGTGPIVDIRGTGDPQAGPGEPGVVDTGVAVRGVKIHEFTRQKAVGQVAIGAHVRAFELRLPNLLRPAKLVARGHTTPRMHLTAIPNDGRLGAEELIVAELSWGDLVKEV